MRIVLSFLLMVLAAQGLRAESAMDPVRFACGANAAYLFLKKNGIEVSFHELEGEFAKQPQPDSLLAIRDVLRLHGCQTRAIKGGADFFLTRQGPAIVSLELSNFGSSLERHFSLLLEASEKQVVVLDPLFDLDKPSRFAWKSFQKSFTGYALVMDQP